MHEKAGKYGTGLVHLVGHFHTPYTGWGMWLGTTWSLGMGYIISVGRMCIAARVIRNEWSNVLI